jgi:sterol desaturase/sphingolipid hydroxylase (fatty acid hydroxylase superfamily)/tetratricopeptide (TPR) repeat protein
MDTLNLTLALTFIGAIALEAFLNAKDNMEHYDKNESRVNLIIAFIGMLVNLVVKGSMLSFFLWMDPLALFDFGRGLLACLALFLLVDLEYYAFHVLGHKCRFFWAMHVIHHSSFKFNFTTAVRTPFTNSAFRFGCLAPFVLVGFDPVMVILFDSLIVSFAFFQHTEMIKKLGWLEYIFSTPSHHRVHHASDKKYIDKNYGGVLIIWDKLFGTFKIEEEHPTYGLTKTLADRGVVNVLTHEWRDIIHDVRKATSWCDRFNYIFGAPGWKPQPHKSSEPRISNLMSLSLKGALIALVLLSLSASMAIAQSADAWMGKGIEAEKKFNDQAAYEFYSQAIKVEPKNTEALWRASRMLSNLAGRSADKATKASRSLQSSELAKSAIQLDPRNKEARLCHIIALGLLSEVAGSPSEKLANAKIIYAEAQTIIKLDSLYAPAHFVLGKWHLELAKLNWAEKLACNLLFGGVPKGVSFEKSIRYFEKAIQLQPDYILFHYGKASALFYTGHHDKVIAVLENALRLSPVEPDDNLRIQKCRKLLSESKQQYTKA